MQVYLRALSGVLEQSGFVGLTWGNVVMIVISAILLYLAIGKGFEHLLLVPISIFIRVRKLRTPAPGKWKSWK